MSVSEGTIRRRLAELLQDRVIQVVAVPDPNRLGFHTSAFIGLQVDPGHVESVAEQMAQLDETEHVAITTGSYDVFVWVNLPSAPALASFLHGEVATIKGVRKTETFVSLDTKKRVAGPVVGR